MGVATKRPGDYSKAGGRKRRKIDEYDLTDGVVDESDHCDDGFMEADYEPEETSSDESRSSDELSKDHEEAEYEGEETSSDKSRSSDHVSDDEEEAVSPKERGNETDQLSKEFNFIPEVTERIYRAYQEICKGSRAAAMPLTEIVTEAYRYMNAIKPSGSRRKCPLSFWIETTPDYLDAAEDLESINPDAALQEQTQWIHDLWDGTGEETKACLRLRSILRLNPRPGLLPRPGKRGHGHKSSVAPESAEPGKSRPKRQGTGKPCYATGYDFPEVYQEDEGLQTASEGDIDNDVHDTATSHEEEDESVASTPTTNTDDDEELSEATMTAAITKTLTDLDKVETLRHQGPIWESMLAIRTQIKTFILKEKIEKAYVKVVELREEAERAVAQVVRNLERLGSKNEYKMEEKERLLMLARAGDCLAFIREMTNMKDDVRDAMMGGPPE